MNFDHVRPDLRHLLSADKSLRFSAMYNELWIDHNSSEAVFRMINNIANVPDRLTAPALLVVGPGGVWEERHYISDSKAGEKQQWPPDAGHGRVS